MQSGLMRDGGLPVFALPNAVTFYVGDRSTHNQVITLYNPYQYAIRFRVLCTSPDKYKILDADGSVKAGYWVQIVVRHNDITPANCNVTDKFCIEVQDHSTRQVIGHKIVTSKLLPGVPEATEKTDSIEPPAKQGIQPRQIEPSAVATGGPNLIVLISGMVCIGALLLPSEGEESNIPVRLPVNMKLIFAYVLGLVTMAILKP